MPAACILSCEKNHTRQTGDGLFAMGVLRDQPEKHPPFRQRDYRMFFAQDNVFTIL